MERKFQKFIEKIADYRISETGHEITGMVETHKNELKPFKIHGPMARKIHKQRVEWEDI